jgi:hypothetical protein
MERPVDRRRLNDADAYLRRQPGKLVIIDEIHRVPGLFEILRGIIDDRRAAGIRQRYVVYPGQERYPLRYGAEAVPLAQMAERVMPPRSS